MSDTCLTLLRHAWALGIATSYFAHTREHPVILGVLPHGFTVGIRRSF